MHRVLNCLVILIAMLTSVAHAQPQLPDPSGAAAQPVVEAARPLGIPRESAPLTSERPQARVGITKTIFSLVIVVGLIVLAALATRLLAQKRGGVMMAMGAAGRAPSGVVDVLARYPLGGGQLLVLLRVGPRVLVVNQVPGRKGSMRTLSEFNDATQVADLVSRCSDAEKTSFSERFRAASGEIDKALEVEYKQSLKADKHQGKQTSSVRTTSTNAEGDRLELLTAAILGKNTKQNSTQGKAKSRAPQDPHAQALLEAQLRAHAEFEPQDQTDDHVRTADSTEDTEAYAQSVLRAASKSVAAVGRSPVADPFRATRAQRADAGLIEHKPIETGPIETGPSGTRPVPVGTLDEDTDPVEALRARLARLRSQGVA